MLLVGSHRARTCSGVSRRELLQVGASTVLGLSLLAALRHTRADSSGGARAVLLLWLWGCPATLKCSGAAGQQRAVHC